MSIHTVSYGLCLQGQGKGKVRQGSAHQISSNLLTTKLELSTMDGGYEESNAVCVRR